MRPRTHCLHSLPPRSWYECQDAPLSANDFVLATLGSVALNHSARRITRDHANRLPAARSRAINSASVSEVLPLLIDRWASRAAAAADLTASGTTTSGRSANEADRMVAASAIIVSLAAVDTGLNALLSPIVAGTSMFSLTCTCGTAAAAVSGEAGATVKESLSVGAAPSTGAAIGLGIAS